MKNNRLTNQEVYELKAQVARIRSLASMENFNSGSHTEGLKKEMAPYMMWFQIVADKIENILEVR